MVESLRTLPAAEEHKPHPLSSLDIAGQYAAMKCNTALVEAFLREASVGSRNRFKVHTGDIGTFQQHDHRDLHPRKYLAHSEHIVAI